MKSNTAAHSPAINASRAIYRESARRFAALVLRQVENPATLERWVRQEYANLEIGFACAEALGMHRNLPQAVASVQPRLNSLGQIQSGLRMLELGLRSAQKTRDHAMQRRLLYDMGQAHILLGHLQAASDVFVRGAAMSRRVHDDMLQSAHLGGQAAVALSMGEIANARRHIVRACVIAATLPENEYSAALMATRGAVHRAQGEMAEAMSCYESALAVAQRLGKPASQIGLHASLGGLLFSRGNLALARRHMMDGIALSERTGHMEYAALLHWTLGNSYIGEGLFEMAETTLRHGLALGERAGQLDTVAGILISLGVVVSQANTPAALEETGRLWQRGLRMARDLGQHERMCLLLNNLADLAWHTSEMAQAQAYLDEALRVARRIKSSWEVASVLIQKGRMSHAAGDWSRATRALASALKVAQSSEYSELIIDAEFELIKLRMSRGRQARCREDAQRLLDYARTLHPARASEIQAWLQSLMPS